MILSCSNINKSFGSKNILKDVSLSIEKNEKVAIVGVNGAGKSTLFKIITGEITKDSGDISFLPNIQIGYMSQVLKLEDNRTIYSELLTVFDNIIKIEKEIEKLSNNMPKLKDEKLINAMDKFSKLTEELENKDGYIYKSKIRGVIKGLGFNDDEMNTPISLLSGGQKTRVSMAKLLLKEPDILLLDEPTNHLDINSLNWLEDFLKDYEGSVIIISHDRYFINKIVTKIIEIENTRATTYNGNYLFYNKKKEENREIELKHYLDQQKDIKVQEESIKLLRSFNREKSVKRAESKEKALNKIKTLNAPESLPNKIRIDLKPKVTSGNMVLKVKEISKSFGENILFKNVTFEIMKGEKIALIGPNGIGKTTLLKIILNKIPLEYGEINLGTNVVTAYYDQEQQSLKNENTIFDEVHSSFPSLNYTKIRSILAAFVFTGDEVFKKIGSLSGGEKGRVALAKIMLSGANFLILDEPTNHLDMYSKNILEEALKEYSGTLIYISHDRYFINNTANKILELGRNGVTSYLGNYDYYLEKKKQLHQQEMLTIANKESENKENWKKKKEDEANTRKIKNKIKNIEFKIEETENEISKLEAELGLEEIYTNHVKAAPIFAKKEAAETLLIKLYEDWEELLSM